MRASRSDARLRCSQFLVPTMAMSQVTRRCACVLHAHLYLQPTYEVNPKLSSQLATSWVVALLEKRWPSTQLPPSDISSSNSALLPRPDEAEDALEASVGEHPTRESADTPNREHAATSPTAEPNVFNASRLVSARASAWALSEFLDDLISFMDDPFICCAALVSVAVLRYLLFTSS